MLMFYIYHVMRVLFIRIYCMASQSVDQFVDRFREEFKRYKRNQPPPDYSDVIELREEQQSKIKVSD